MSRRYLRPSVLVGHVLVLAAALTCLRLGWWQWGVAHAVRGTVQNLGYALLWPVFAGAFIYMWLRFLHLESVRDAEVAGAQQGGPAEGRDLTPAGGAADSSRDPVDTMVDTAVVATAEGSEPRPAAGGADGSSGGGGAYAEPGAATGQEGGIADGAASSAAASTRTDAADAADDGDAESPRTPEGADELPTRRRRRGRAPHEVFTVAVATVGDDDDDDPELAAYNQALAALAEQDRRRAH